MDDIYISFGDLSLDNSLSLEKPHTNILLTFSSDQLSQDIIWTTFVYSKIRHRKSETIFSKRKIDKKVGTNKINDTRSRLFENN